MSLPGFKWTSSASFDCSTLSTTFTISYFEDSTSLSICCCGTSFWAKLGGRSSGFSRKMLWWCGFWSWIFSACNGAKNTRKDNRSRYTEFWSPSRYIKGYDVINTAWWNVPQLNTTQRDTQNYMKWRITASHTHTHTHAHTHTNAHTDARSHTQTE